MAISSYYKHTATFKSWDGTLNALGTPDLSSANYDAVHSNIRCLLRPMGAKDKITREKKVSDKLYWIYCQSLSVREDYLITIDSTDYRIIGFKDPNSLTHHMEIEAEIIQ